MAADEDLVQWNGASFSLVFDASGSVGGVDFDDEDVLLFDPGGPSWTLLYDGSAEATALAAADVEAIALPEPGQLLLLASGIGLLLGLGRRRIRR